MTDGELDVVLKEGCTDFYILPFKKRLRRRDGVAVESDQIGSDKS